MAQQIMRYLVEGKVFWGVHKDGLITPLGGNYATTGDFLTQGGVEEAQQASSQHRQIKIADSDILSPVTNDAEYICQGMNYASHLKEIGRDPAQAKHNILFQKASSAICPPNTDVIRPPHIQVLDYENELGLVVKKPITAPIDVSEDNLHQWIGGFVITNDVSAREEQLSHEQFHKAKSYRTFGPTGPFLVLLAPEEMKRWRELMLTTKVNGEQRQHCAAADMIFGPVETLSELSRIRNLKPGDLIATGTPAGVGMKVPGKALMLITALFMSAQTRYRLFLKNQARNPRVLKPGDKIELTIATEDGAIDLGRQMNNIIEEQSHA